jgi:hypothetical protein
MEDLTRFGFRKDFDLANKIVKQEFITQNEKEYLVSTVDLGINHNFREGAPLWYETMIFPKGTWNDLYCNRYETREEAQKAHNELIEKIKNNEFMIEEE